MERPYGVGIIGVQPGRSWAAIAHIPALKALSNDYRIVGIANTSLESAQAAVQATGVGRAFATVDELIASPDVDIVAVTVKVPHHLEIVRKAINAGKHVYCEWPIGNGLAETRELTELAKQRGVLAVAGTQARLAPVVRYARDLVAQGYVGKVLSVTLVASGMSWGGFSEVPNAYNLDIRNGVTMLTIPVGHTLAAVADIVGEVGTVSALLKTMRTQATVVETGEVLPMSAHDQVLVAGELESGAPIAIHYRGGMPRGTGLLLEINGDAGDLQISGMGGHAQFVDLTLRGATGADQALQELPVPDRYKPQLGLDMFAQNVGEVYQAMARDLAEGSSTAPTFADAERTHRVIAAIEESAQAGRRVSVTDL